jgi:Protein of unknown function (DUF2934)
MSTIDQSSRRDQPNKGAVRTARTNQRGVKITRAELAGTAISKPTRQQLITEAAYHRAEARGFAPGNELEDWLAAEAEVDARLMGEGRAY